VSRLGWVMVFWLAACASARSAAQRDPMLCERDPSCAKTRGSYPDCDRQCNDDPECVGRCKQMQPDPGLSNH
jgi:hypothetical protein